MCVGLGFLSERLRRLDCTLEAHSIINTMISKKDDVRISVTDLFKKSRYLDCRCSLMFVLQKGQECKTQIVVYPKCTICPCSLKTEDTLE